MSSINCTACDELTNHAPLFAGHGITDYECYSLMANTGLNSDAVVLHSNAEDLHDMNDCLIGRLAQELLNRNVCDWKPFMKSFIQNLHAMEKAIICDSAGVWIRLDNHEYRITILENKVARIERDIVDLRNSIPDVSILARKDEIPDISGLARKSEIPDVSGLAPKSDVQALDNRVTDLCTLVGQSLTVNLDLYGILNGTAFTSADDPRRGGTIMTVGGLPAARARTDVGAWDSLGIEYKKMTLLDCSGAVRTYEWIMPRILCYFYGGSVTDGTVLWRVDLNTARGWGMTDSLLTLLRDFPQWWIGVGNSVGTTVTSSVKLSVDSNYLNLTLIGSSDTPANRYVDYVPRTPVLHIT